MKTRTLGICLGASTVSIVESVRNETVIKAKPIFIKAHDGNPKQTLLEGLGGIGLSSYASIAVTGRKFHRLLNLTSISEPEAVESAFRFVNKEKGFYKAIISMGGETFIIYALNKDGLIYTVCTGSKCASGTGEFFLQQIRRMNISLAEALEFAKKSQPHKVSGRCSVFCKSDCTHALNRGEHIGDVVAGLAEMVSKKATELMYCLPKSCSLSDKTPEASASNRAQVMVIGGVSQNSAVMEFLKKEIPNIDVPNEAPYFEALGAALWAQENKTKRPLGYKNLFKKDSSSFESLPNINSSCGLVSFKTISFQKAQPQEECILGLDVGSTTTKAVILRIKDDAILGSVYLKTNGNPIQASRNCYRALIQQVPKEIKIKGLGVTGSGRQIAGLHALTKGVINEIIAHATAAAFFDKEVDTIFEIGGQDAKYTYLINGVPCDYAMNEACSAGTGSFLEESAKEALGIEVEDIAEIALRSQTPANFNDRCAAFIQSDIKNAIHEGMDKEAIIAGLVYSICLNYNNRVRGSRPVGKKIFMQGGVCLNKAVPLAMASLIGKEIIVPPQPGLMGALGVALEIKNKINQGLLIKEDFDLNSLAAREIKYTKSFVCKDSKDRCDRKCLIAVIKIEDKNYPFGGVCNRYYNMRFDIALDTQNLNWVRTYQRLAFQEFASYKPVLSKLRKRVGINKSFLVHSLFPLYYNFFSKLGLEVVLSSQLDEDGIQRQGSAFCYPAGIAHGLFGDLLKKELDYIFLPQVVEIPVKNSISQKPEHQSTCFILQAEPYYLKEAFKDIIDGIELLTPVINFSQGYRLQEKVFIRMGLAMGFNAQRAKQAFHFACGMQEKFYNRTKELGDELLKKLKDSPDLIAIVLFGRPYNAFCSDVNMEIPHKFATRGALIIPFDFLPYESCIYRGPKELLSEQMTWATGQKIIKAASFVKEHPQLFGAYITNFSCGPDSFLLTYFRDIMGNKPSLTLEIDSHTQDVGLDTRVEAFLEIIKRFRQVRLEITTDSFNSAQIKMDKKGVYIISSDQKHFSLTDSRVQLLLPSMGDLSTQALASVFKAIGINALSLPVPDWKTLNLGRANASGKECLPLILVSGSLIKFLNQHQSPGRILVYFMPTVSGNCRFSQYNVFLKNLIRKNRISDLAILSLTSENGYGGLGRKFMKNVLKSVIVSDIMDDIRNALQVLAKDNGLAMEIFKQEWDKVISVLASPTKENLELQLERTSLRLQKIPLKYPLSAAKSVSLLGEIFMRKELFSRRQVVDKLIQNEIIPKAATVLEWLYYVNYLLKHKVLEANFSLCGKIEFMLRQHTERSMEKRLKKILAQSNLYSYHLVEIEGLIECGRDFVDPRLTGEPIIVIGAALQNTLRSVHGAISIGPFACLPSRVTEAILSREMLERNLPFLSIEADGNSFPQVVEAKLEAFCLQVKRSQLRRG